MAGKLALWVGMFVTMEEGLDRGRAGAVRMARSFRTTVAEDDKLVEGSRDFLSTTLAGLGTAGLFSAWNRFPAATAVRTMKMGAKVGLLFGIAEDAVGLMRGRRMGYVDFVKRRLFGVAELQDASQSEDPYEQNISTKPSASNHRSFGGDLKGKHDEIRLCMASSFCHVEEPKEANAICGSTEAPSYWANPCKRSQTLTSKLAVANRPLSKYHHSHQRHTMVSSAIRPSALILDPRIGFSYAVSKAPSTAIHVARAAYTTSARQSFRSRPMRLFGESRMPIAAASIGPSPNEHVSVRSPAPPSSKTPFLIHIADENAKPTFTSYVEVARSFYPSQALRNLLESKYKPTRSRLSANPNPSAELTDSLRQLAISSIVYQSYIKDQYFDTPNHTLLDQGICVRYRGVQVKDTLSRRFDGKQWEAKIRLSGSDGDAAYVQLQAGSKVEIMSLLTGRGVVLKGADELVNVVNARVYRKELDFVEHRGLRTMPRRLVKDRVCVGHRLLFDDDRIEYVVEVTEGEIIKGHERSKSKVAKRMRTMSAEFLARHPTLFKTESAGENLLYPAPKGVLDAWLSDFAYRKRDWDTLPAAWKQAVGWTTEEEHDMALESGEDLML
ncbi:hypothetical protein LTR17_004224 [Elasticomyces elasticus]|nr:hypothetical protein LTR17_004224 [Elasticomyces elasticus]